MTDEDFGTFDLPSHAEQMLRGMDRFAESVKRTLGPKDDFFSRFSSPEPSPEDLTAWGINADDPYEVMGARVLTEAAIDTNRLAGGGATTTTILGESILRDSARLFYNGIDPVDLRDGIELAARHAVRAVKRHAYKVLTADHSTQVGTIAADGDQRNRPDRRPYSLAAGSTRTDYDRLHERRDGARPPRAGTWRLQNPCRRRNER